MNSRISSSHATSEQPYQFHWTVQEEEIDGLNHVNNLNYLRWTNRAAHAHSASVGWSSEKFKEHGSGFVVRSHEIQYRLPALMGDEICVETWIGSFDRFSSERHYRIVRSKDGKLLAKAKTVWAFVNFEKMRLAAIPQALASAFGRALT
ncbi:MAG: acyl-CoA thioesterase [Pirellulaceae bacterium]